MNRFDAEQKKEVLMKTEELVRKVEAEVSLPGDRHLDRIRKYVNQVVLGAINKNKDDYANLKKELLELGVEALSDHYLFDDHFDEKYGGSNEN